MLAVKAVEVSYQPSEDVLKLLETFKDMVNYCIQAGLENNITSRFRLTKFVYHDFDEVRLPLLVCSRSC